MRQWPATETGALPMPPPAPWPFKLEPGTIALPKPQMHGGMPLMTALSLRRSSREFSDQKLAPQTLADLLWAAYGVNRPDGGRTAADWRHIMAIEIFVANRDGVGSYDPVGHALVPLLSADIRPVTGLQEFVKSAPLELVYVAHGECMSEFSQADRRLFASVDCGFIGQNVYLFCASAGLATVFRGAIDYAGLEAALGLHDPQFVCFAQTVGYPVVSY